MISRNPPHRLSLLLAGTALVTMAALPQSSFADALKGSGTLVIAQAAPPAEAPPADKKPAAPTPQQQKAPAPPQQQPPQARPNQPPERAAQPQQKPPERAPQQQERTTQQQQPSPSTAQQPPTATPPAAQDRRDQRRMGQQPQAPAAQQQQPSPSTAQQPQTTTPPTAQDRRDQRRMGQQPQAPAAQQPLQAPTAQQPSQQAPVAAQSNPATIAAPTQPRDAREFMRRDGQGPGRRIDEVRKDRQETRDGDRVVIREGDRTIIREGDRTIIRHNESNRFTINASNVRSERRGANTETIVQRGGGYSIVTVTDDSGRLLRRMRRDQRGRDVVIIDNGFAGPRAANMYIQLAPPVIRIPRERYIVEMGRSRPEDVYGVFIAPPVEALAERYTLDQVRYSAPLRDRMPRVDLDVTFETGSWQLSPEQIDKLSVVAEGISKALARNPQEVFMVEGYTDATGADEDNLSLSDRRAESVAVALTEQFKVPPENLVTQGYGEQYLKVDTQGPEEANRRVAVRRITPLIDGPATNARR